MPKKKAKKVTKKAMKRATTNEKTVFVLCETWNRNGDNEGSPTVTTFSNIKAARKRLRELVKQDNDTGITETLGDEGGDWEVTRLPNWYHAWSRCRNSWVDFTITEKLVHEN